MMNYSLPSLLTLLVFASSFCFAHPGGRDAFGCHRDKAQDNYHCHEGKLAGRTFATKEEAQKALAEENKTAGAPAPGASEGTATETAPATAPGNEPATSPTQGQTITDPPGLPAANPDEITLISWNVKKLGHKGLNLDRVALLLSDADVVAFQEVLKGKGGQEAVRKIAELLAYKLSEKICWGLTDPPSGSIERYAYVWRDKKIAYVKTNGEILDTCTASAVEVALDLKHADKIVREPALGTFYSRSAKERFTFASVHLLPAEKRPQDEVAPLFSAFENVDGPLIIAGDFNLRPWHEAFMIARQMKFLPALKLDLTSLKSSQRVLNEPYDNFWYRKLKLQSKVVINLFEAFPDDSIYDIYNKISDHCPIKAVFKFEPAPAPAR